MNQFQITTPIVLLQLMINTLLLLMKKQIKENFLTTTDYTFIGLDTDNKLRFYNVSPRPKIAWVEQVISSSTRLFRMLDFWYTHVPNSQPHQFGNKQNVINVLKGVK